MSEAYKVFDENYSFADPKQGIHDDISKWSLMCWREAFKWGYEYRDKKFKDLEAKNKQLEELLKESCKYLAENMKIDTDLYGDGDYDHEQFLNKDLIKELIHKGKTWKHINRDDI